VVLGDSVAVVAWGMVAAAGGAEVVVAPCNFRPAAAAAAAEAEAPPPPSILTRAEKSIPSNTSLFCLSWAFVLVKKTTLRWSSSTRTFFRLRDSRAARRFESSLACLFVSSSSGVGFGFFAAGGGADADAAATSYPAARLSRALRFAVAVSSVSWGSIITGVIIFIREKRRRKRNRFV
jgi:hypothetical protein